MEGFGNIILYEMENHQETVSVTFKDETFWLTQKAMSELFGCSSDNISLHLKNIFSEGELIKDSVTEKFSATASEDIFFLYTRDLKGGIKMGSTSEKIKWALFDYIFPTAFMFLAIFKPEYYVLSANYLVFAMLTVGFFNSQGPFLYMFIFPVCGLFIIPGYWHLINFNYELFATVGGLACFPVGSFLINSYAARF